MTDYFLCTKRLGFRHWTEADYPLAVALWGDPEVTRLIGGPFSPTQIRVKLTDEIARHSEHGVQYWPMFLLEDGAFVGCCGLRTRAVLEGIYELGFHLCRQFWGGGYATEAASAIVEYAFQTIGARSLFAGHHPENTASGKVLEKLGFRYDHDELYPPTGRLHPSYVLPASAMKTSD
jgi:[ribosomal protein S5]-alanine N-acetyltransferase